MPVYAYRCENCGVQFERRRSFNDAPLKVCPECHKRTLKKVIASVGVVFKGSGFYSTDHKSASGSSSPKTHKTKEESKETKSDEKKPDEKKSSEKSE